MLHRDKYTAFIHEKINPIKNSSTSKLIYKFNTFTIKIPTGFFAEVDKQILKFIWKGKAPRLAENNGKEIIMKEKPIDSSV